jgi:3-hydroxybutyryl-CoA dehydratase
MRRHRPLREHIIPQWAFRSVNAAVLTGNSATRIACAAKPAARRDQGSQGMNPSDIRTLYFEDLSVGMRESFMKTVLAEDVVGFAELSGDHNPIHLSDHFAQKTRFGGRIAHGLYTASLISAVLGMRLPGPGAVYLHQTLNFKGPVRIGDVVTISVEVVELTEQGRRCRLHCECVVDGKVVLDGEALVMAPSRHKTVKAS